MSNLYRMRPEYANGKDQARLGPQVENLFHKTNENVRAYFDNIGQHSARKWPDRLRANPYNFSWPGEDCRDLFLHMMFTPCEKGARTRFALKDLMRFLLFRFQIAKKPEASPQAAMKGYPWRYFATAELVTFVGHDERQLQDEVRELIERGLLVRVQDRKSKPYPYLRPSDDLFRVCIKVTMMNDADYLRALFDGGKLVPAEEREYRECCRAVLTENRDAVHQLVHDFMTSDAADRAAVFCAGYDALAERYWPTDDDDLIDDERYAEGMRVR